MTISRATSAFSSGPVVCWQKGMTSVYLKSICVVKTPVFCCFKKKHFWILSRQKKKTNQNAKHLRIQKKELYFEKPLCPSKCCLIYHLHPLWMTLHILLVLYPKLLSYNSTKTICNKWTENYSMNINSQKTPLRERQTVNSFVTQVLITLLWFLCMWSMLLL